MKKFTSLLIGCSLALAGAAMAQQPDEQATPKPKQAVEKGKGPAAERMPKTNEPKPEGTVVERHGRKNGPASAQVEKAEATPKPAPSIPTRTKVSSEKTLSETTASATPAVHKQTEERKTGMTTPAAAAKTSATPVATATAAATAAPVTKATATPAASATASATPVAAASASPAASAAVANERTGRANQGAGAKKPDPQKVEQIKVQHANFRAQPKPDKVPAVTFTENRRVEGSDRWQGQQYEAFRSYHAERHDQGWYHSHYNRVELIGGGYYYWNNGYWYPAWGYNDSHQYYAYDGPIYVGHRAEPLDRVIADVQSVLQEMGYYKGEVDGLLGPLTREALTAYQEEQGLAPTAAIDEPTLDSLGMG
ncbi:MAG: peptidoglycan-binding protein [Chthoniobacterales bacterium]